jgi:hypothetical protein
VQHAGVGLGRAGEPAAVMGHLLPANRLHHPGEGFSPIAAVVEQAACTCAAGLEICTLGRQVVDSTDRGRVGIARKELTSLLGNLGCCTVSCMLDRSGICRAHSVGHTQQ